MKHTQKEWPAVIMTILGALWLGAFPLWQDLSYAHITKAKWLGALVLCGVTLLAAAVMLMILAAQKRLHLARRSPLQLLAAAYFAWVALSAWQGAWADSLNGSGQLAVWMGAIRYEGLLTQLVYGLIFLTFSFFPVKTKAVKLAAAAALVVFTGIVAVQYAGVNVLGLFPKGRSIYTNYEFQGTIGNIDMVSGYLSLITPLLLGGYVTRDMGGWLLLIAGLAGAALEWCMEVQSGLIALALLCALLALLALRYPAYRFRVCVVLAGVAAGLLLRGALFLPWLDSDTPRVAQPVTFTFGRQAALGLVAAVFFALLAWLMHRKQGKAVPARWIIALVAAVVVLVVGTVMLLPIPESAGGLYELHEILCGRVQDHFGSWRLGVWRHSLDMSRESLLFGNGPDTFYYAMHDHLQEAGAKLGENFDNPHNEYVAILANNGLPALLTYLALLGWTLLACIRRRRWPLALAIGCYAAQGFFSFSICLVSPMFWAVMGMAAALCGKPLCTQNDEIQPEVM